MREIQRREVACGEGVRGHADMSELCKLNSVCVWISNLGISEHFTLVWLVFFFLSWNLSASCSIFKIKVSGALCFWFCLFFLDFFCNFLNAGKTHKLGNFLMGLKSRRRGRFRQVSSVWGFLGLPNRVQTAPAVRRALISICRNSGATGPWPLVSHLTCQSAALPNKKSGASRFIY